MGFSEKAKNYFYDQLNFDNREVAKMMGGYSESLVSRYLNSDKVSASFVLKIKKYFPDAPVDDWAELNMVNEEAEPYQIDSIKRINRIIGELKELKKELQNKSQ